MSARVRLLVHCISFSTLSALCFPALAEELYLNIFYGVAPVSGAEVRLGDRLIGSTDGRGSLLEQVEPGQYQVIIGPENQPSAAFELQVAASRNTDVFVDLEPEAPTVAVDSWAEGDDQTDVPTGAVSGLVTNMFGMPVEGASVVFPQLGIQVLTDEEGGFQIEVPRGEHMLSARHPSEGQSSGHLVRIAANVGVRINLRLEQQTSDAALDGRAIEEVLVLASAYNADAVEAVDMEREALTVVDALDYEQIARFGDSTVAAAVRRVVGVTVRDGKYAIIRGLEGRYISTTLNGSLMPSTDPLRRDAELDLFPADILESIEVQKGFTADQMGDATAGSLKINTRGIPESRIAKLSISGSFRDGVTGESTLNYEGSETDDFGFDNGFRELPTAVERAAAAGAAGQNPSYTTAELTSLAQSLTNVYNLNEEEAVPGFGLSAAYGDRYYLDSADIGFYSAVSWGFDTQSRIDYLEQDGARSVGTYTVADRVEKTYDFTAYLAGGLQFNDHEYMSKTIFLRQTQDQVENSLAIDASDNDREYEDYVLEWTEREFVSQQFTGQHFFGNSHEVNWSAGVSQSSRYQPDRRSYQYDNGLMIAGLLERRWSDLTDDALNFEVDYQGSFYLADDIFSTIKVGGVTNTIDRETSVYRLGFDIVDESFIEDLWNLPELRAIDLETMLIGDNLSVTDVNGDLAIEIDLDGTEDTASYHSTAEVQAFYIQTETEFGDNYSLVAGIRQEDYRQEILYPNAPTRSPADLDSSETLASLGLNWTPNEDWLIRFGYSNTLSYPGLTERSESLTYDGQTGEPIFGNGNLVPSKIENFDFRAEYYLPDGASSVSFAYFYKEIEDPIERARSQGSGGVRNSITYRNNEFATVEGWEIDANLTIFDGVDWDGFIAGNIANTESEITLDALSAQLEANPNRGLQGLSPWIANLQFGVDHIESEQSLTLVVNFFDDRIDRIVTSRINEAIYELGRTEVGLNYEKTFLNGSSLSVRLGNLLDEKTEFSRETTRGVRNLEESFSRGRTVSVGYSYEF